MSNHAERYDVKYLLLSFADVVDVCRVEMGTSVDDIFCVHISKGIVRHGRTEHHAFAVSAHESNNVSRSEYESMFEQEGTVKENKIFRTKLVSDNPSCLHPRERKRFRISRKALQALRTQPASEFKAVNRISLMCDN